MDFKSLLSHLADGEFHSGEDLGAALGISRTAVWKQLQKLADVGLELDAGATISGAADEQPQGAADMDRVDAHPVGVVLHDHQPLDLVALDRNGQEPDLDGEVVVGDRLQQLECPVGAPRVV